LLHAKIAASMTVTFCGDREGAGGSRLRKDLFITLVRKTMTRTAGAGKSGKTGSRFR